MTKVKVLCSTAFNAVHISALPSSSRDTNPGQSLDLPLTFQDSRRRGRDGTISIGVFQTGASVVDEFTADRCGSRGNCNAGSIIRRPPSSGGTTPVPEHCVLHKILGVQKHHTSWHSWEQEIDVASVRLWFLVP